MDAKRLLLDETLRNPFHMEQFLRFIKEFFNKVEIISPYKDNEKVWSEYKYHINSYTYVAKYRDIKKNNILILAVKLQSNRSVDKARSIQRNFISKLISDSKYDAAVVAFYSDNDPRWRLSFVKLVLEFDKGKVKTTLTPAKRYSYLVGEGEPSHTAQERLYPIFKNENFNPTIDTIEEAFSVEAVSKDFFDKYKRKYYDLKKYLDSNQVFLEEASRCQFTSEQFAKKLLGQLAFLYFLQKKGWLGVKVAPHELSEKEFKDIYYRQTKQRKELFADMYTPLGNGLFKIKSKITTLEDTESDLFAECFKGSNFNKENKWGSGPKNFIRELFKHCTEKVQKNFFNDFLEPLFYEALNKRRGNNHYYSRFNCKIPFLNGGLFDALENYDWKHNKFQIPNEIFSNESIKGKEEADGILDIFDRYNFTMNEDEPLEKEIAVDPEMLGKIFEDLLDITERKSKGAFYTPREIVHYMCQESLINYLVNKVNIPYEDMKDFILYGELMKDEDCSIAALKEGYEQKIPQSIFGKLTQIDLALKYVKVADPAVGSGAFSLGMLNEIVKARTNITEYFVKQIPQDKKYERLVLRKLRHPYKIKWETIKNCIFGVDIEPSAVDIAKLRLWLSIIVEQEIDEENIEPHALPNLDCNIMCGNSLIDELEGVKLFDERLLENSTSEHTPWQTSLFDGQLKELINELFKEQDRLFGEDDPLKKQDIKESIDNLIENIIRMKLSLENNNKGLKQYEESLKMRSKPYFLWQLEFGKVFKDNGGFDIVIGNPPYVNSKDISELNSEYRKLYKSAYGSFDIYVLFFENGKKLLKEKGVLSYITSNKFFIADYGKVIREIIIKEFEIISIVDLAKCNRVFKDALVSPAITILNKITKTCDYKFKLAILQNDDVIKLNSTKFNTKKLDKLFNGEGNVFDIYLNNNDIAIIEKISKDSKSLEEIAEVRTGIMGFDYWNMDSFIIDGPKEGYIRIATNGFLKKYKFCWEEKNKIYKKTFFNPYLDLNNATLNSSTKNLFKRKKIIIRGVAKELTAVLDTEGIGILVAVHSATIYDEANYNYNYVLGLLNSKLLNWYHLSKFYTARIPEGSLKYPISFLKGIPIKDIGIDQQNKISELVERIFTEYENYNKHSEIRVNKILKEIDSEVYKLYQLNEKEVNIIERLSI